MIMTSNDASISLMNEDAVHKICSGQVIVNLAMCVKELIENSLDANSSIINITLKEYGSELIEISDNGSGILEKDFSSLALKHYTSKLTNFKDVENISTLGFRGEALSSICALSEELVITTKHYTSDIATKLIYDQNGKICDKSVTAREKGTTVLVRKIFCSLPVRRKEFLKNLKREFNKMCYLLQAYCLISERVKFMCTHIRLNGCKSKILATEGGRTIKDNVIALFGYKQLSNVIDIDIVYPNSDILNEYGIDFQPDVELPFSFQFMISNLRHGSTKSSQENQFYYVNSRPCEPGRVIKLINDVYKQYNMKQTPFVYLNILMKSHQTDINITPDKRQILLHNEKLLLATLKMSLLEEFKKYTCSFPIQHIVLNRNSHNYTTEEKKVEQWTTKCEEMDGGNLTTLNVLRQQYQNKFNYNKLECDSTNQSCKTDTGSNDSISITQTKIDFLEVLPITCNSKKCARTFLMTYIKVKIKKNMDIPVNSPVKFNRKITPEHNKTAEDELHTQLSNVDFGNMKIIGQFNLGFIITKLLNDLFIIDQHASDENYNFNILQLKSIIQSQTLVIPKRLTLSINNERILLENQDKLKNNGFCFMIDKTAKPTQKILLTAVPVSNKYTFGQEEIEEMLYILQDSSNKICRPSRIRSIFASKACRKSVMIGKFLSTTNMQRIINQMSKVDEPWNCPHGRPTMRHLINIKQFLISQ